MASMHEAISKSRESKKLDAPAESETTTGKDDTAPMVGGPEHGSTMTGDGSDGKPETTKEKAPDQGGATPPKAEGERAGAEEPQGQPTGSGQPTEPKPTTAEGQPRKYATLEDAEKAAAEAEKRAQESAQQIAELRTQYTEAQKKLDEAQRANLAETQKQTIAKLKAAALAEIQKLDPNDPNLMAKEIDILAEMTASIQRELGGQAIKEVEAKTENARRYDETLGRIKTRLTREGFDADKHLELFLMVNDNLTVTQRGYSQLKEDEAYQQVFGKMRELTGFTAEKLKEIADANNKVRRDAHALPRGGNIPPTRETERRPKTLSEQIKEARRDKSHTLAG